MNPKTHLTLHDNGMYSLIHQGLPLTTTCSLETVQRFAKRLFPKANSLPVWIASEGKFSDTEKAV